jgi:hypothetical protein
LLIHQQLSCCEKRSSGFAGKKLVSSHEIQL